MSLGALVWTHEASAQNRSRLVDVSNDAPAQSRSRLVDASEDRASSPRSTPRTVTRARVPDARLFDDMTVIEHEDRSQPSPSKAGAVQKAPTEGINHNAPSDLPNANDATPSQRNGTLFASATIHRDKDEPAQRSSQQRSSQAYVPMLPKDFYAPTNVRRDPIASEVGVADMQPAENDSGGFRYLERRPLEVSKTMRGIVKPYDMNNVFSTFGDCRPGGRTHAGLDVGGVGPDGGIGTPIYAMSRVKVTYIGRPEDDPDKFGQPDRGRGHAQRGPRAMKLPRTKEIPGYGVVNFFTRTYGSWRTGTILVMEGLEGPLKGHRVRYMHLGAIHPELRVGDIIEGGQEVGLMGGTAVLHDMPHVHIDIENAKGARVDVAPYVGLPADNSQCR